MEKNMTTSINAVGFELETKQQELVDKKIKRISYAEDLIIDFILRIKRDKQYSFDAVANFRWGVQAHVTSEDFDFAAGLNKLMDVLDNKIKKEKDKIQEKK
jgi:putative sigma-54 modulation protein